MKYLKFSQLTHELIDKRIKIPFDLGEVTGILKQAKFTLDRDTMVDITIRISKGLELYMSVSANKEFLLDE